MIDLYYTLGNVFVLRQLILHDICRGNFCVSYVIVRYSKTDKH